LSTRYGTAQHGRDHGEIIIYCWAENALQVLSNWRDHLISTIDGVSITEDSLASGRLSFRSEHVCKASGCVFKVRHSILPLYFKPVR
jgi:hypothetical protein